MTGSPPSSFLPRHSAWTALLHPSTTSARASSGSIVTAFFLELSLSRNATLSVSSPLGSAAFPSVALMIVTDTGRASSTSSSRSMTASSAPSSGASAALAAPFRSPILRTPRWRWGRGIVMVVVVVVVVVPLASSPTPSPATTTTASSRTAACPSPLLRYRLTAR